jgi:hypothetical protein
VKVFLRSLEEESTFRGFMLMAEVSLSVQIPKRLLFEVFLVSLEEETTFRGLLLMAEVSLSVQMTKIAF